MTDSYSRISVPLELRSYYKVTNVLNSIENQLSEFKSISDVEIKRDNRGCILSVVYYTPDRNIEKEVFYKETGISKINYYRGMQLCRTEVYKSDLLIKKSLFQSNGNLACSYEYEYDLEKRITSICKTCHEQKLLAIYKYDDLGRISYRKLYKNDKSVLEQHYKYDVLDRIIEYKDENQHIIVNKITPKNELISYVIIDKIGNKIVVENLFSPLDYVETKITLNEHSSRLKNTSYVDNIMLKKPYASEDDLDLVIANLFSSAEIMSTQRISDTETKTADMINTNIQYRTLPISMRKRLLLERTML